MYKKLIAMLLALSMAAMLGCSRDKKEDTQNEKENVNIDTEEEAAADHVEDMMDEDSVVIPVLEDSIFDEESDEAQESQLVEPEAPEISNNKSNKNNQHNNSGNKQEGNTSSQGSVNKNDKPSSTPAPTPSSTPTPTLPPAGSDEVDYEAFQAMSPAQQQAHMESFADLDQFFDWYNAEKEKYEKEHPSIEVDGGSIDLDKIVNGN